MESVSDQVRALQKIRKNVEDDFAVTVRDDADPAIYNLVGKTCGTWYPAAGKGM